MNEYDIFDPMCLRSPRENRGSDILKFILSFTGLILLVDFLGAMAWTWSGQSPEGVFYIGTITVHLLRFLFQ